MSMLDPDQRIPVVLRRNRCVNCSLLIPRNQQEHSLQQASTTIIKILQSWITPTELSPESVLCAECMVLLQDQANSALPLPAFGHRSVCFSCGRSILYASRTYPVRSDRQERNVILRNVPLHLASRLEKVCSACWMAAYREVRRQNQHDTKHPTLPDVGTSGDFNIPTPPPLPQHAWHPSQCYTIIANVYNYLSREYELLKSQLGERCDLSSLANILKRTAAATGVTQQAVTAALDTYKLKTSICSDHSYNRGNTNARQDDESDGEGMTPPKRRTAKNIVKSTPANKEQLPQINDSEGEEVRPPKRRSARNNVRNIPSNEEQFPYPVPIQSGAPEAMEMEYTAEPADDESQQTLENDPLETLSRSTIHCRTPEATETVFKAEPPDDQCLQKPEVDPLETESSPVTLEEPSNASEVEMKVERLEEESADLCTDYSICDPVLLDIKPELPFE